MSYRIMLEAKRLAADKPAVLCTLGELREKEKRETNTQRERYNAVTKR